MYPLDALPSDTTLDLFPGARCILALDGTIVWAHAHFRSLMGPPGAVREGQPFDTLFKADHRPRVRAELAAMVGGDDRLPALACVDWHRPEPRWIRWEGRVQAHHVYVLATRAQVDPDPIRQLREANHLLELADEIAGVGHFRFDFATRALAWSRETFHIHGLDPAGPTPTLEEAVAFYVPADRVRLGEVLTSALLDPAPFDFELRLVRTDSSVRLVRSRGIVEVDPTGTPCGVVGVFQDITDERRMLREVCDNTRQASLETLARGVAHEINNPLQYLQSNLEMLTEALTDPDAPPFEPDDLTRMLDDSLQGVRKVEGIVQNLRAMAATHTHGVECVDLGAAVASVVRLLRHRPGARDWLEVSLADTPPVEGRMAELCQVLMNLLLNATRAIKDHPGGRVVVRAFTGPQGNAVVEVEDTGAGIPAELEARVFEPFFTTEQPGDGVGLGLHISRAIAQAHGGSLSLWSGPMCTRFRLVLPPATPPP